MHKVKVKLAEILVPNSHDYCLSLRRSVDADCRFLKGVKNMSTSLTFGAMLLIIGLFINLLALEWSIEHDDKRSIEVCVASMTGLIMVMFVYAMIH